MIYIVIPVYNVDAYLERCLDSILNQTYRNYEIVLIDDGSADGSLAICDRYAEKYDKITVFHQENSGQSAARNLGIDYVMERADMERSWITFIDSDDFVHPLYLEFLYQSAGDAKVDISSCSYIRKSDSDTEPIAKTDYCFESMSPEDYWCKDRVSALLIYAKLYRLRCFKDVRYPEGTIREDEFITHTILFPEERIAVVWLPLYCYYFNNSSTMTGGWHPGHLAALDAFEEQIRYFRQHGFDRAYKISFETLCEHTIKTVRYIKELSPRYDSYLKPAVKRRTEALKAYGRQFGRIPALRLRYYYGVYEPIKRDMKDNESFLGYLKRKARRRLVHTKAAKKISRLRRR